MFKTKKALKTALFGGLVVILPVLIFAFFLKWLFNLITNAIQPLTNVATSAYAVPEIVAHGLVVVMITLICFLVGFVVQTRIGKLVHRVFDKRLQKIAPGYRMVREVIAQIFDDSGKSPFGNGLVARVRLFGMDIPTEVTALVTDQHDDGSYTIFMPTGPNPTSGNIYHVKKEQVTLCPDIKLDSAMRTVIACGAGSGDLFKAI